MKREFQQGELQEALALAQAGCYAAISIKDLPPDNPSVKSMTDLAVRLTDLALERLEDGKTEQTLPDRTDADTVQ